MRRTKEDLVDRHLKLHRGDWEFLVQHCEGVGIAPGELVRRILHQKVKWMRAALIERLDQLGPGEEEANAALGKIFREEGAEGSEALDKSAEELGF